MNPTQYRFEHLATQLKWRLQEGRGEAVYQIGVEDNGLLVGLTEADMKASLKTLKRMAERWVSLGGGPALSPGTTFQDWCGHMASQPVLTVCLHLPVRVSSVMFSFPDAR